LCVPDTRVKNRNTHGSDYLRSASATRMQSCCNTNVANPHSIYRDAFNIHMIEELLFVQLVNMDTQPSSGRQACRSISSCLGTFNPRTFLRNTVEEMRLHLYESSTLQGYNNIHVLLGSRSKTTQSYNHNYFSMYIYIMQLGPLTLHMCAIRANTKLVSVYFIPNTLSQYILSTYKGNCI
jgi:hypothetical protein